MGRITHRNAPSLMSQKPVTHFDGRDVTAILGPTNTGKTHYALERMVAHSSGMIGLPLRLLAREVYTKLVLRVGRDNVALITGEEKIQPKGARFHVCTVEAMPKETDCAFLAIDEVQLAQDLERGHVFTNRLLHLRGRLETLFLGADTMAPILKKLMPAITITSRPRMSQLFYAGSKKITRLPPRSAIVAFSADEVYAIAELIRRQSGGAAVVMGALSPRTRNAQVQLYQNGDVDFIVATDAIGMGLNLDVGHVAFAQARKFDGHQSRNLTPAEIGQIAGRAGRHVQDGTFGVTGRVLPFEEEVVRRVESHDFDAIRMLQWRAEASDFSSPMNLRLSLDAPSIHERLTRALPSSDVRALDFALSDEDMRDITTSEKTTRLLWDVCALPDYRKITPAQHGELVKQIYCDIAEKGHIDEDYMARQIRLCNNDQGEIDALSQRIAQIRTWTYVSNRPGWLAHPQHWQEQTRAIEDRLSDALHEKLTKRFVDRRTSVLMKRLRENTMLDATLDATGRVMIDDMHVGSLEGFRFTPDSSANGMDAKAVKTAAQKALANEFEARAARFGAAANEQISISSDGTLRWIGAPIAKLASGDDYLTPRAIILADEQLTGPALEKVQSRVNRFIAFHISNLMKPLIDLKGAEQLQGFARGLAFQLVENHGIVERAAIQAEMKTLDQDARAALRRYGIRFGFYHIFVPALLKPAPAELLTLLWAIQNDGFDKEGYGDVVAQLASGRTSVVTNPEIDPAFYPLAGFRLLGSRAVRFDILERLADLIRPSLFWSEGDATLPDSALGKGAFMVTPAMMSILGATSDDMDAVLTTLGYRGEATLETEVQAMRVAIGPKPIPAETNGEAATEAVSEQEAEAVSEPVSEDASPEEPAKTIMVWRQQRKQAAPRSHTGQNRNRQRNEGEAAPARKGKPQRGSKGTERNSDRHNDKRGAKPLNRPDQKAKEKPIDPDSPFAKLMALKGKL